jgi:hypothetical protein
MQTQHPCVDFASQPEYRWPAWKLGMQCQDLITTLHQQYNTYEATLQDFEAFHHDVLEISTSSSSTSDFHLRMEERKQLRLQEMTDTWDHISSHISAAYGDLSTPSWGLAVHFFRTMSLDSLVRFFGNFLDAEKAVQTQADPYTISPTACETPTHCPEADEAMRSSIPPPSPNSPGSTAAKRIPPLTPPLELSTNEARQLQRRVSLKPPFHGRTTTRAQKRSNDRQEQVVSPMRYGLRPRSSNDGRLSRPTRITRRTSGRTRLKDKAPNT